MRAPPNTPTKAADGDDEPQKESRSAAGNRLLSHHSTDIGEIVGGHAEADLGEPDECG
jgi:hypothetical protein